MKVVLWANIIAAVLNGIVVAITAGPHELQWFCIGLNGAFAAVAAAVMLDRAETQIGE